MVEKKTVNDKEYTIQKLLGHGKGGYAYLWNFENWGIHYWSKTPEFLKYMEENK